LIVKNYLIVQVLVLLLSGLSYATEAVSLTGEWRFQLDRTDAGQSERWFDRILPEQIQLPGALQNQGYGDDITTNTQWTGGSRLNQWHIFPRYEKYRQPGNIKIPFFLQPEKHYVGAAWYQRDIDIPADWNSKRVVLTLERPHWETKVWLDDQLIGTNDSLSTPHVYDLGTGLMPGRHRLTIRVDNNMKVWVGGRAHSVSDETQGNWNGIVGELKLSATSPVWIEDVQAYPDVSRKAVLVKVRIGNVTGKAGKGTLTIDEVSSHVEWSAAGGAAELEVTLGSNAQTWDEFTPALQMLHVKLTGSDADDERPLVFGLRDISTRGHQFLINGRPTFFRGTLECCIFPLTGYPPTDVDSWKRIIRICKEYGLNHIRFHSWCPPKAAFTAADELGFYYSVEAAAWTQVGDGKPIDQWLYREAARILQAYGNHPSFLMMPYGNEPSGKNMVQWFRSWVNHWKQTDPRRLYTSAAGWPLISESQFHVTPLPRGESGWFGRDYQYLLETSKDWPSWVQATVDKLDAPVIVHEMGRWVVFPNFDEVSKYTGPLKPKNFDIFRDSLAEQGMLDQWKDFFMASGKFQALCYKEEIEAALRTPDIGGIQLLDLRDFPGQGTALVGVLDPFWDSKPYISAAEYRRFYNSTVPLTRLLRRTWTTAETLTTDVMVAHFGAAPLDAHPYWKVLARDGRVVTGGELPEKTVPVGKRAELGQISLALKNLPAPEQYKLVVGLNDTPFENDWNFWVYPAEEPVPPADVLLTQSFDDSARQYLASGGTVLLASDRLGTENPKLTFRPITWNRYMVPEQNQETLGLLCDPKHQALAHFPTEFFQDLQWYDIFTSVCGVVLDSLPQNLKPIVQPIDDWNTNRKLGLVFECRVGKGKLLVCSADLVRDLDHRLAARQLRTSLLAYAASEAFDPKVEIPVSQLDALLVRGVSSRLVKLGAKVIDYDSQAKAFPASQAIDGNPDTIWHTPWGAKSTPMPHHLVIDLGREVEVVGVRYLPRLDTAQGRWAECDVYVGSDPHSWTEPIVSAKLQNNNKWQTLWFPKPVCFRYLKVVVKSAFDNFAHASVAELDVILAEVDAGLDVMDAGFNPLDLIP